MRYSSQALAILLVLTSAIAAAESDRNAISAAVDVSWSRADTSLESWLERGEGKLRFDESHDGFRFSRAFLDYRGRITDTINGRVTLNSDDDISRKLDLTEAFLEWRPLPSGAWRLRSHAGAFYPRLSLENTAAGWSSPYALSASAINTWIGEELRIIGAEARLTRGFVRWPELQLSVEGGTFYGNDPTGALLTWRGWASHDRQTGLNSRVPTPQVSTIAPWDASGEPLPRFDPFKEIDHKPGFYVGGEWQWGERARLKITHYDNHADPEAENGAGEYAWQTWFDHIGGQIALPWEVGLIGQYINGSTRMGPDLGPWRVQDVDFNSTFLMLTRAFGPHRLSTRYEWFQLEPFNDPDGVTNKDNGNILAVAYLFQATERIRLGAEYLQIASDHCATDACVWVWSGLPRSTREEIFQLTMRWGFETAF